MLFTSHEPFLTELSKMFELGRHNGKSVWVTFKRYDGRTTRNPRKPNDRAKKGNSKTSTQREGDLASIEHKCLIRAKLGNKKISVVIGHKDINKFQLTYSNLIKGNISGLKKQKTIAGSGGTSSGSGQHNPPSSTLSSKGQKSQQRR